MAARAERVDPWVRQLGVAAGAALVPALTVFAISFASLAETRTAVAQSGGDPSPSAQQLALGKRLYGQHCASCHGVNGQGQGEAVPPLVGSGGAATYWMIASGRMPAQTVNALSLRGEPKLDAVERDAVVAYVDTFAPGENTPIPDIDVAAGDLQRGRFLFINNCAACHGAVGQGAALSAGVYAPDLRPPSATEVGAVVRWGPYPMPVFDEDTLGDHDLNSLVRYVKTFDGGVENPGGLPLGYGGPVMEGLVAFVIGLGLLFVVIRGAVGRRYGRDPLDPTTVWDDDEDGDDPEPAAAGALPPTPSGRAS